jgi:hypothetical protein
MLPYLAQHPNLVVLRTMSKSYSLAGARLGLLFAAAPVVAELTKVKDSYNVNAVTQAIGVAALEDRSYHEECVRRTLDQRARLERELEALGWTWPESAANFLLCEIGERAEQVYTALKDEGLLVRWWKAPELRTKIRISVGNAEENDHLIAALKRVASNRSTSRPSARSHRQIDHRDTVVVREPLSRGVAGGSGARSRFRMRAVARDDAARACRAQGSHAGDGRVRGRDPDRYDRQPDRHRQDAVGLRPAEHGPDARAGTAAVRRGRDHRRQPARRRLPLRVLLHAD